MSFNLNLESHSLFGSFLCSTALSEISRGLASGTTTILNVGDSKSSSEFSEFLMEIHRLRLQTCIFNETEQFFKFIESNLKGSLEVTALIFHNPAELIPQVTQRNIELNLLTRLFLRSKIHELNLAHRLSLYVFFWDAKHLPKNVAQWNLKEPLRTAMITNPRKFVYRIYYNQATSLNDGTMRLVNWYDGNNLGLNAEPILSHVKNIYENFNERNFIVPVAHVSEASCDQSLSLLSLTFFRVHLGFSSDL